MSLSPARSPGSLRQLLQAPELCRAVWQSLGRFGSKLDLHDAAELFHMQVQAFQTLLQVYSPEELLALVDEDDDGVLDEDDQLLIFTLVRERLRSAVNDLNDSRHYVLSQQLAGKARELERDISFYQEKLRHRLYQQEYKVLEARHRSRQRSLDSSWEQKVAQASKRSDLQLKALTLAHKQQLLQLDRTFNYSREQRRVKPRETLRQLQHEERVAAATEAFAQAQYLQRTVSKQQASDSSRAAQQVRRHLELRERTLRKQQAVQLQYAQQRAQKHLESLKIKAESERWQVEKVANTRLLSLQRLQELGYQQAAKAGREDLRRTKFQARETTQALDAYRKYTASPERWRLSESLSSAQHPLTELKHTVPRFHLRQASMRLETQISGLQAPRSLAQLYNTNLEENS